VSPPDRPLGARSDQGRKHFQPLRTSRKWPPQEAESRCCSLAAGAAN
jgi:hypothetical protein